MVELDQGQCKVKGETFRPKRGRQTDGERERWTDRISKTDRHI